MMLFAQFLLFYILKTGICNAQSIYTYTYNIKLLNEECTVSLIENRDVTFDKTYSRLKNSIKADLVTIYRRAVGDSDFFSATTGQFSCISENQVLIDVVIQLNSNQDPISVKNILVTNINDISDANVSSVVLEGASIPYLPAVRNNVETELPNEIACDIELFDKFREKLASRLLIVDNINGLTNPSKGQIVFAKHACADVMLRFKHSVFDFYVSKENAPFLPDKELTVLAYRVIDQMIYEGSAWKLGFAYHKNIQDITLIGADDEHEGLSDVEIIFLGFGIICAILLLIIIIILIARYCFGCCHDDEVDEEKRFYVTPDEKVGEDAGVINNSYEKTTVFTYPPPDYEDPETVLGTPGEDKRPFREVAVDVEVKPSSTLVIKTSTHQNEDINDEPPQPLEIKQISIEDPYVEIKASSSDDSDSDNDEEDTSTVEDVAFTLDELIQRSKDDEVLENEFKSVLSKTPTIKAYSEVQNGRNREKNIFPWTHKRVLLSVTGINQDDDYINASFVKNATREVAFISTQAPLNNTVVDFWQMIWEQNVTVIVMGTPLNHRGDEKCVQYWPTDETEGRVFGKYTVLLESKDLVPDYVATKVSVTDGDTSHNVSIYRFMSWPTRGLPNSYEVIKSILKMLSDVQSQIKVNPSISVFHGSTSRGFGTVLLAIMIAIDQYNASKTVCVKRILRNLRKDQAGAIENVEQYKYIYQAISVYGQEQ